MPTTPTLLAALAVELVALAALLTWAARTGRLTVRRLRANPTLVRSYLGSVDEGEAP